VAGGPHRASRAEVREDVRLFDGDVRRDEPDGIRLRLQLGADAHILIVKLRSRIVVSAEATREQVEQAAIQDARTQDFIAGKPIKKIVVVPDKLVNIVV